MLEGTLAPLSTSTPVHVQQDNQVGADDTPDNQPFQPMIPGISHASLYPALSEALTKTGSTIPYYEQVIYDIENKKELHLPPPQRDGIDLQTLLQCQM